MKKDTPITNDLEGSESVLGDNLELFILHREYLALTDGDKKEETENADKN